jgi:hypothetical protein
VNRRAASRTINGCGHGAIHFAPELEKKLNDLEVDTYFREKSATT